MTYLKQSLEDSDILGYSWIQGEKIVADIYSLNKDVKVIYWMR